jgi:tRNA pseudouridine65 synthase
MLKPGAISCIEKNYNTGLYESVSLRILFQNETLVAVDKPAGFHVHPPEDTRHTIPDHLNCLRIVRDQLGGRYLYPVHRLDRATSGVLLFALSSEAARELSEKFQRQDMKKTYFCVVRGELQASGRVEHPLDGKSCTTEYSPLAQKEFAVPVGRYPTARYTLTEVRLLTGRMHQIRRHFAHFSHPLIGDTIYGDGKHNRFFREHLGISQLLLKAYSLEFEHHGRKLRLVSRWSRPWHEIFDQFGACPAPGL